MRMPVRLVVVSLVLGLSTACGQEVEVRNTRSVGGLTYAVVDGKTAANPYTGRVLKKCQGKQAIVENRKSVQYKEGRKHGTQTEWACQAGHKSMRLRWRNGKKHGTSTTWYSNGQRRFVIDYEDGSEHSKLCFKKDGQEARCP